MVVKFDDRNEQEIEMKNQNSAGSLFPFDWKVKTKGTWSNLMIRLASNPDVALSREAMTLIDASVTGSSYFFGSMDGTAKVVLKAGLRDGQYAKYGIDAEMTASGRNYAKLMAEATLESFTKGSLDFKLDVDFYRIGFATEARLEFELAGAGDFRHILFTITPTEVLEYKFELKGIWTLVNSDLTVIVTEKNSGREKTLMEFSARRTSHKLSKISIDYDLSIPTERISLKFECNININRNDFDVSAKLSNPDDGVTGGEVQLSFNAPQRGSVTLNGKLGVQRQEWSINYDHSNYGDLLELIVNGNGCDYLKVKRTAKDNGRLHTLSLNCSPFDGDVELFMDIDPYHNYKLILSESWTGGKLETNIDVMSKKIDGSVKLTHPQIDLDTQLSVDASQRGQVNLNGKLEVDGRRLDLIHGFNIKYEHSNYGDLLELIVSANGCDALKVKRSAKDNGRLHTLSLNCQLEVPTKIRNLDGDVELFVATTPRQLDVTLSESWTGRKMEINLNTQEKELSVEIERSGVKVHEVYAKVTPLPIMYGLLRYKKNGTPKFVLESQYEQPTDHRISFDEFKGYIDIKMSPMFDMRAEISNDG